MKEAIGGNKIKVPAPIGGVVIDLTKICKMIHNSGGATSLTVSQILAYAASQSNVRGSVRFGNVTATQELAKGAFDAINNEAAFSP